MKIGICVKNELVLKVKAECDYQFTEDAGTQTTILTFDGNKEDKKKIANVLNKVQFKHQKK